MTTRESPRLLLAALLLCFPGCTPPVSRGEGVPEKETEAAPQKKTPAESGKKASADNSACFVCHSNYEEEFLAVRHAEEGIGCTDCHGESMDHADDEDNITPPDVLYARNDIEKLCRQCHDSHDVPPGKVIALWRKRALDRIAPASPVCTDCHGEHRLNVRTVRWNKKTRELLPLEENK